MAFLKSLGYFLQGILKRIYWLLPSMFSDPFDIAERWFHLQIASPAYLPWVLAGIGFFVAALLTFHEVRQKSSEKPKIHVEPLKSDSQWYLNVHNDGDIAVFAAQIMILETNYEKYKKGRTYMATWSNSGEGKSEIMRGHYDSLKITMPDMWPLPETRMPYSTPLYDPNTGRVGLPLGHNGLPRTYTAVPIEYEYKLKVNISSNPSLEGGVFTKIYRLTKNTIEELAGK